MVRCQRHVSETAGRYCDRSAMWCLADSGCPSSGRSRHRRRGCQLTA